METHIHAQQSLPFGFGHSSWDKEDTIAQSKVIKTVDGMLTVRAALSMNYSYSCQENNNTENKDSDCISEPKR